jgi:nickel/cobalt transporter (NicO) family protein
MNMDVVFLCWTAAIVGLGHTLLGPDHYLPFIVMNRARKWSPAKTAWITFACGLGHVLSSVVLGFIGIAFGMTLMRLEAFEAFRGNLAAWALIGFGFAYAGWGIHCGIRNRPHTHLHLNERCEPVHSHRHAGQHFHTHEPAKKANITPWVLFTIFVLGPCEPLIPLLMYPAARYSLDGTVLVAAVFSVVTIGTMLAVVMAASWGISFARFGKLERWTHALAGGAIGLSGLAIQFLGL